MKNILYITLSYITYILSLIKFEIIKCENELNNNDDDLPINFSLTLYDENFNYVETYPLTFNYTTYLFNEYETIKLFNSKTCILCKDENDNTEDRNTILFWTPPYTNGYYDMTAVFLSAFPVWLEKLKKQNKNNSFCLRIDDVGWVENVNGEICNPNNSTIPCPDLIMLGTTQFAYRYNNGETLNLGKYFRKFFIKNGNPLESLINKYSFYDYHNDNDWLAVPIIVDFRNFRFNITTFDYCREYGYKLYYPPPLSDYWGPDYHKTWTWETVIEYAKMIKECTGLPGFRFDRSDTYEDLKFFIMLCQSLGIPFINEDLNLNLKTCGFRNKEYINKLLFIKELFENHYILEWLDDEAVNEWLKKETIDTIDDYPKFRMTESKVFEKDIEINGLFLTNPFEYDENYSDIKYAYMPGSSTFLGGAGIVITYDSKFPDELFEYIEVLIDENYPYFTEINTAATPFENTHGKKCSKDFESKKDKCNSFLESNGSYPYYYIFNNITYIIYLTHISVNDNKGVLINLDNPLNSGLFNNIFYNNNNNIMVCDEYADYQMNTITYNNEYEILFPLNNNETIILKSMKDISDKKQSFYKICSIYDETLKIAKPYQFPYSTFAEINNLENDAPISYLFANLYYKNNTNSFESLINFCCDIIDKILLPECEKINKISYAISECNEKSQKKTITYLNCRVMDEKSSSFKKNVTCSYIPYINFKGLILIVFIILSLIIDLIFLILIIVSRKNRYIYIGGYPFLVSLVISSMLLITSMLFWLGKVKTYKCIIKFWILICGVTGFICSYSIKTGIVTSIYNSNSVIITKNRKVKSYYSYFIIIFLQLILLILWTFTQNGVKKRTCYLNKYVFYENDECSKGSQFILIVIFGIDYLLLLISVIISYRGRNVPAEFNDSKKVFVTSLMTIILVTFCYLTLVINMDGSIPYFIILLSVIIISLIIVITFVGSRILVLFNLIEFKSESTIRKVSVPT
ncbi:hypothetical protein U3516DRAFT_774224 [Neocallimastix sp. 'constans']